jgi:hypothetical protein
MLSALGAPRTLKTVDCSPVTNPKIKRLIKTANVGPFRATGLTPALESLTRIFAKVKTQDPELYGLVGSAGMLCCRLVRGSKTSFSNHSWGTAIDLTIGGQLDGVGDGKCLQGLLELYKYFKTEEWFWGSEFSREDSMHFEASDELIHKWSQQGLLK